MEIMGIQHSVKTWEHLVDKLFAICKWDASCLYHIPWEHLSVAMFELSWLERSPIRPSEVEHLSILPQGVYIKKCRLKVENANLSMYVFGFWDNFDIWGQCYQPKFMNILSKFLFTATFFSVKKICAWITVIKVMITLGPGCVLDIGMIT